MRSIFVVILTVFMAFSAKAQQERDSIVGLNRLTPKERISFIKPPKPITKRRKFMPFLSLWEKVNRFGLDISEVAFVNWNAGGSNSVSGLLNVDVKRIYKQKNFRWNNELIFRYGINKQKEQELRKTDDHFEVNSTFGYRQDTLSNWYTSAKFNFITQVSNGYNYPNTEDEISTIMSPANTFLGVGTEYNLDEKNLNLYISPMTVKSTIVLDQELANAGAFGVTPAVLDEEGNVVQEGENTLTQLGFLFTNEYQAEIFENIGVQHRLSLYTDYLNNFGNVDVSWELNLNFQVNDYVLAKLGSHLKYDDDVKIQEPNEDGELVDMGSRIQWKQQLGIGVIVEL
ncbi:DUF3078 domain-containing protein [Mesonia sp. K7]|uniref:DUF3078 domain-containing protein n=1 Tax=Mesonia sp. K7 TaxID=2218606 RepID=UPI000DA8CAE8|nr:DUF3078 domain-containing protein [Mesonia sp. K7]PZD79645.1 hypothetical protein DNG35_01155 [Mesonia sp. K7]